MDISPEPATNTREKTFEVVLRGGKPWGFEVSGGIDENQPLILSNITEEGKAWESGLIKGDVIIRVNDIACLSSNEARQLINSAFRTLTLKLWRSSNTPDRLSSRTTSYRKRVEDVRSRDIKPDVQDDSVVYDQSKSSQGLRMRPRTRRGESFSVKKSSRNRGDQEQQWQTNSKDSGQRFYENQQPSYKNPLSASLRKLAPAKSSPSLNKIEIQVPSESQGKLLSGAKSSPNLNNEIESEGYGHVNRKHGECYNNNYERYSLDGPTGLNASWNLGSGDFKRSYTDQSPARMHDITDSYEKERKSKKNSRRSLPPYMLQKYQADYENISDYGTTPLRSEKISEIDDLDSDEDVSNIHILQTTQLETLVSPQSPPIPPVRDPSSLKYIKINQTHEKYPSWPVTKSNSGAEPPQPINTRAQSWTDTNTNTNKDFPVNKARFIPGLRPLPERNSPNAERREDGKLRAGSDPGLKSEFVYDKYGRVQQRDYNKVDQNQIKKFYEQKPGYPPPKLDSDGHNLGDEKYNVPSPPERDVPGVEERERFDENTVINKSVTRPTSFTTQAHDPTWDQSRDPPRNKLNYGVQNTIGSMSSQIDVKGGQLPLRDSKPEKLMVDSCTSPQHSPKDSKPTGSPRPRTVDPSPSSQLKSTTKAYIVKQTPYYNTSTQTDQSPPSNSNMQITIPKPMPRKTVSDNAAQTSPTSTEKNVFMDKISPNSVRPDKRDYNQKEKRSNYSDINSPTSRQESDNHSAKHSGGNYADFSALQANYADISNLKSIHERYSSDIAEDNSNTSNNIPHYSEYTASQAPILRELSREFYKGRMPGNYDKRVISPNELSRSSDSMQPGMKEAESYSSVIIHSSESAGPFGRDDFGSRSSLSDSRQDIYSVISESTSSRSSIAKGRRSLDPGMLSHRPRPLNETRYNSSTIVNHARTVSSPTSDYRRPRRSSEASTPSQPKSSPDSRSSGSTYYSSSDTSQSRLLDISHDRHESIPDSVFSETRSPLPPETELKSPKSDSKDKNMNMNLGRKQSMKKAYGIYDETERVLRGAAATLKAVNDAQNLRRSGENYAPAPRLSRGSSESKILDQIQEENDVFVDLEGQRSRSSSGKEDGSKTSDKTKRELFSGEYETQRKSGMKRSSSEQIHKFVPNSLGDQPEKTRESTPNLATQTDTVSSASRSNLTLDIQKRNSESDLKKIQQQAVLNFMEIKTGKRMSSSGSQEATTPTPIPTPTGDAKDLASPTQSVQELISKTSENLAHRTQRTDSFRRSGSSSSSRNSQDYMEMNRPRKETEWSKMRSQGVLSYGSNRSSLCSENTYEDINVFSPRNSTTEKPTDDLEVPLPDSSFDRPRESSTSGMDCNLISSPTYQNLYTSRRRPPPPPPLLSPDDKPPALPPRNYRKPLNDPPSNKSPTGEESVDHTKLDFKSLMNQWEGSPREDSYAADLRRQARRFSEQQPNSTNMSILHSKTKINFSQSYKREPVLVHQATPPQNTNSSFEEKNRVTSPVLEQPMVIEEGNKENKAPSTPVNQPMSDEEMKTPPRVDRSLSELSLPSPPINYGTLESNHSELPPPPPEVLEEAEQDDQFADDSYGAYRNKSARVPGSYKRSVSDANVHLHLENSEARVEDMGQEKKKLGHTTWNSESSLSGAVSQPKRPRDVPSDNIGNVPSFKVESLSRNVVKGTTEPLGPPNRFTNVIPNNVLNYSAQNKPSLSKVTSVGALRMEQRVPNTTGDKDAARSRVQMIEKKGPITKSQTEADRHVAEWLNKNETMPNSPVNSGLQPKNINENLNVQRSKTFNTPRSQNEVKQVNSGKHYSPQDEIKKRSAFNSPIPYGSRSYQSSYAPVNIATSPQTPMPSLSNSNRPKDGNKPVPQERASINSKPMETSNYNSERQTRNSPTDKSPAAKSARYSGEFIRDRKSDNFRANNPQNNDKILKTKGSYSNEMTQHEVKGGYSNDMTQREVKGGNSPVNSNNQSFVISSNSAQQLSPSHNVSLSSPTSKTSSPSVQSNNSSIEKNISSSSLPPGTVCHGRQRSQEELDCDQKAKELAKELNEQDKKLSDVLVQDSNTKRMQYMDGLFIEPVKPRKLSSDESEKKVSSPSDKNRDNSDHSSPNNLPASYYTSPPKALMEIQLRNNNDLTKDLSKDIVHDNSSLMKQKEELMEKLHKKLDILRKEKSALEEEIGETDQLGEKMMEIVESRCEEKCEQDKYKLFIQDQEKIVRLLLNLAGQLARAENAVQSLNNSTSPKIKKMTLDKRERLQEKHEDAKVLKENIDKRSQQVLTLLQSRLTESELEDYNYYIKMKSKLTIDYQELEDRIKLGEEQIQELKKSIPDSKC